MFHEKDKNKIKISDELAVLFHFIILLQRLLVIFYTYHILVTCKPRYATFGIETLVRLSLS